MNKKNHKRFNKLILFAILIVVLLGKLLFTSFLLFTVKNALAVSVTSDEIVKLLDNIHTMQANFSQYHIDSNGKMIGTKTCGKMSLLRPGKFRWEIIEPNKQLILIKDNYYSIYDVDLEQLIKHKVNYRNLSNPILLLSSPAKTLKEFFTITKIVISDQENWFKLIPKTSDSNYRWVKMHFSGRILDKIQIMDNLGQRSIVDFSELIFNIPLTSNIFTFIPPPNTDILEDE
jgi:outer membrane lipoprotein carrier protein